MTRRFIDTDFWNDPDVLDLEPAYKLMIIHLITHPGTSKAGVVKIHPKTCQFHVGVTFDEAAAEALSKFVIYWPEKRTVLIRRFIKWQCANKSFFDAAIKSLESEPDEIKQAWYEHNSDLLNRPKKDHSGTTVVPQWVYGGTTAAPTGQDRTGQLQEITEQERVAPLHVASEIDRVAPPHLAAAPPQAGPADESPAAPKEQYPSDFVAFWQSYRRPAGKGSKPAALREWRKLNAAYRDLAIKELATFQASKDWQKESGQYIPHAERYLKLQLFLSPPEPGNGNGQGRDSPGHDPNCPWCRGTGIKINHLLSGDVEAPCTCRR